MSSALTFFLADALSCRVLASVHARVIFPSPQPEFRPGGGWPQSRSIGQGRCPSFFCGLILDIADARLERRQPF